MAARSESLTRSWLVIPLVFTVLVDPRLTLASTELPASVVDYFMTFTLDKSPYVVRGDLVIERTGFLRIDPGVELQFMPGIGLTVRGKLEAQGTESQRIRFTRAQQGPADGVSAASDIRLVDGPTPFEGRLQISFKGRWRSVCTNSKNWTLTDFHTTCRQLGFDGGTYSRWHSKDNDTFRVLYEMPRCENSSASLFGCVGWASHKMGAGICDLHPDIGIRCEGRPTPDVQMSHWRGLFFDDARTSPVLLLDGTLNQTVSQSTLLNVDVWYAGYNASGYLGAGIEVFGVPPTFQGVSVKWSALNGINSTEPGTEFTLRKCDVANNRGHGVVVNNTVGGVYLYQCSVTGNGGDGVHYNRHTPTAPFFGGLVGDLCTAPNNGISQVYPLRLTYQQTRGSLTNNSCQRDFMVNNVRGQLLTVHVVTMITTAPDGNGGSIQVRDGRYSNSPLLGIFPINNNTFPASITSTGNSLWVQVSPSASYYVAVSLLVEVALGRAYDLNVSNSEVRDNGGRGVAAENPRCTVHVTGSKVTGNRYAAGIHVLGERGSGDVNVTTSNVSLNVGDGVRVTYSGGRRNISQTVLMDNALRGVYVWVNETGPRPVLEREHTVIHRSRLERNAREGLLVANFCGPALINVSESDFLTMGLSGVRIISCLLPIANSSAPITTLRVTNSRFDGNTLPGVIVSPVVNSYVYVAHNTLDNHKRGALVVRNGNSDSGYSPDEDGDGADDDTLASLPAKVLIERNTFRQNSGTFVASVGVSERGADRQQLTFSRNILRGNTVAGAFPGLVSRRRTPAVLTVGSTNAVVIRNRLENPLSKYEIASHALGQYSVIDATLCFFGGHGEILTDAKKFNARIFDSKWRADLALVNFMPYLLVADLDSDTKVSPNLTSLLVNNFYNGSDVLGGVVYGTDSLPSGIYTVAEDVFVPENSILDIGANTKLQFMPSTGLFVQGTITIRGESSQNPVILTQKDIGYFNDPDGVSKNVASVRLVEGTSGVDVRDGRLEVLVGDRWGTVCARARWGWDMVAASLACQQMGMVVNPDDWWPLPFGNPAGDDVQVVLANVKCTPFDTDLSTCEADKSPGDLENVCNHGDDVYLRCYRQAWAGVHFGLLASQSRLDGVLIERAGVLDYSTRLFEAGLRLTLQKHVVVDTRVAGNLVSGLAITFNDLHAEPGPRRMETLVLEHNGRDGLLTRTAGLHVNSSRLRQNRHSGVRYDPGMPKAERRDILRWIDPSSSRVMMVAPGSTLTRALDRGQYVFVVLDASGGGVNGFTNGTLVLDTGAENSFGVQVFAKMEGDAAMERAEVMDGNAELGGVARVWNLREDLIMFPTTTGTSKLTVSYFRSSRHALGNAVLYVTVLERRYDWPSSSGPTPTLRISHSVMSHSTFGMSSSHYEWESGERGERYLRTLNESVEIVQCSISDNKRAAIYVDVSAGEFHDSPRANVTYTVNQTDIMRNGGGVEQGGRDSRGGHTLLHWVLADNVVMHNTAGGFRISPPYVDPYDAKNSHSVHMYRVRFKNNTDFSAVIVGHYARVRIDRTEFSENRCASGLLAIRGTEKEIDIQDSAFDTNHCAFLVDFAADSHADAIGYVRALFRRNSVRYNTYDESLSRTGASGFGGSGYGPRSYAVGIRGVQRVDVIRNLFGKNKVDFELLSGVPTSTLDVRLNATENWWGTVSALEIVNRLIFDFDDWNAYSLVAYSPFLNQEDFGSGLLFEVANSSYMSTENLGGRLYGNLYLARRPYPYIVRSDLTIMPSATLTIEAGVLLQFYPGVGILVLGTLRSQANEYLRTRMEPYVTQGSEMSSGGGDPAWLWRKNREKVAKDYAGPEVRLCFNKICGSDNDKDAHQGFLEVRNVTTGQWVPVCDPYFTERNAEVACRELGHRRLGAFVTWGARWDLDLDILSRVTHWPWPRVCTGGEPALSDCAVRQLGPHPPDLSCAWNAKTFAYIRCEPFTSNIPEDAYWGGVRFAVPSYEARTDFRSIYTSVNTPRGTVGLKDSILEYVDIIGGGVLHGQRAPALGMVRAAPMTINAVNVTSSAWHGVGITAPQGDVYLQECRVEKSLGIGINLMVLQGETRDNAVSSFAPLDSAALTYNEFGMVSMCTAEKELMVSERVLVYYKYSSSMAECVKVFRSAGSSKPLGLRLLQLNLYDGPSASADSDRLQVLDGDLYGLVDPKLIVDILPGVGDPRTVYKTKSISMTLNMRASGASESFGFIAEVTTLPSAPTIDRDQRHNVSYSQIRDNLLGGLMYSNTGEVGPTLTVIQNQFTGNGMSLYGNLSTSYYVVGIDVQNTMRLYFQNNLVAGNQGGLWVQADSETASGALQALVTNNVFTENAKWESLYVGARRASTYQTIEAARNVFTLNPVPYRDVISFRQVVSTFTYNLVYNNTGSHILMIEGFPQSSQPRYQVTTNNHLIDNLSMWPEERSTIVMVTPGQRLEENILLNPRNDFELMTGNVTSSTSPVDATNNWWGYNQTNAVQARIRDGLDRADLVTVEFQPFYMNNYTLVSGWCPAGWKNVTRTCLLYAGGVFEYKQAVDYCMSIGGTVPYMDERNLDDIRAFIAQNQPNYNPYFGVWVRTLNVALSACTAFYWDHNHETRCETRLPTLCERNPDVFTDASYWAQYKVTIAAVGAVAGALLLVIIFVLCWLWKSRRRHQEKLERRNSIRSSIRSNSSMRFAASTASSTGFTGSLDLLDRRKVHLNGKPTPKDVKLTEVKRSEASLDSITKPPSRFGSSTFNSSVEDDRSYEVFEAKNHHFDYSDYDDGAETEAGTLPHGNLRFVDGVTIDETSTDPQKFHYGFPGGDFANLSKSASGDNSQLWGSSTGTDDTLEVKRGFGSATNGVANNAFHSTHSLATSNGSLKHANLLETDF